MARTVDALSGLRVERDRAGEKIDVDRLVLDVVSDKHRGLDVRIDHALEDGRIEQTMDGAPNLTLSMSDSDNVLLQSGMFDYRIDVELDEIPFRLVKVSLTDDGIDLGFEHRVVAWLREHDSARKFSRGKFTRAEAAYSLVREVKAAHIRFVSPDLHKRQPITKAKERPSKSEKEASDSAGIPDDARIMVGGRPLTRSQKRNAERALDVAASLNASPKATKALIEACIVEAPRFDNPTGGHASSVGILQLLSSHLGGSASTNGGRRDVELVCRLFLTKGFWGKGGAIALAKANPTWSAGQIAQNVQGSAFPARYDQVSKDADRVIDAYQGGGASFGGGGAYWAKYEFTRGQPGKREDTWECTGRWAEEVRWRRYVVGRRSFYFVSDDQLMRKKPRYVIDSQTPGLLSVNFDMEVGKRHIVQRGKRVAKPSEAVIRVRLARWAAPPGSVIELDDYGPANGRWLVDSIERSVFDAEGTIHLRQPQKALPEPRSEQRSRAAGAGGSAGISAGGKITTRGGAKGIVDQAFSVAKEFGEDVFVVSAFRASSHTSSGNLSDHSGNDANRAARDIAVRGIDAITGPPSAKLDDGAVAIARAFGRHHHKPGQALVDTFTFKGYRVQIIWRTPAYGGHMGHIHVGAHKA